VKKTASKGHARGRAEHGEKENPDAEPGIDTEMKTDIGE
jgi:hypothetical protein